MLENLIEEDPPISNPDTISEDVGKPQEIRGELQKIGQPALSTALFGLELLSHRRELMRANVLEQVERRLYRNIFKPAMAARKASVKPGDICVWKVQERKRPTKSRTVMVVRSQNGYPKSYEVQYYLEGERAPPEKTGTEKFLSTAIPPLEELYLIK